jgi:hypothetical protein
MSTPASTSKSAKDRTKMHRFYHADRYLNLVEGQTIELDSNGLTRFGAVYWEAISTKPFELLSEAEQREWLLERERQDPKFAAYPSRMQVFFAANTVDDARRFVEKSKEKPNAKVPIFEVFASTFWSLDMNWLDYATDPQTRLGYIREYWYAAISNHCPAEGERRPPLLEVLMKPPVRIGKVVAWA